MKAIYQARSVFLIAASVFLLAIVSAGQAPEVRSKDGKSSSPANTANSVPLPAPTGTPDPAVADSEDKAIADEGLSVMERVMDVI